MSEIISGIYCILNILNNKRYIGCSQHINRRWCHHKNNLRKNKHNNYYLQKSWNKYGEEYFNFYIIEECSKELLKELEVFYVEYYKSNNKNFGYNLTSGGDGLISLDENCLRKKYFTTQGNKKSRASSSKYVGVYYDKYNNAWVANSAVKGKHYTFGYFSTEISAATSYNEGVKKLFGDGAKLNIISEEEINLNNEIVKNIKEKRFNEKSSKYFGVVLDKRSNLWRSRLSVNGKRMSIGYFKTETEAALAYNEAASYYLGWKAKLNEISEKDIEEIWR
jgi:group I intron endonuclease